MASSEYYLGHSDIIRGFGLYSMNKLTLFNQNNSGQQPHPNLKSGWTVKIFQKINLPINISKEPAASISRYVSETGNDADTILETLGKEVLADDNNARQGLIQRSRTNLDLLTRLPLKRKLSDEEKADIFRHIIGNPEIALSFLEYVAFIIPSVTTRDPNFLKNMVQNMINASGLADVALMSKWLDAIARLGIQSDQVDMFVQKLRGVRSQSDEHKQVLTDFVSRNSKDFGKLIVKEFAS